MGVQPALAAGTPLQSAGPTHGGPSVLAWRPCHRHPLMSIYVGPQSCHTVLLHVCPHGTEGFPAPTATPQRAGTAGPCGGPCRMGTAVKLPGEFVPAPPKLGAAPAVRDLGVPVPGSETPLAPRCLPHPTSNRTGPPCPTARPCLTPLLPHSRAKLTSDTRPPTPLVFPTHQAHPRLLPSTQPRRMCSR